MLKLTLKMTGKMEGMTSINSACSNNTRCQARINAAAFLIKKLNVKDKSDLKKRLKAGKIDTNIYNVMICWFCYADSLMRARANNKACFEENGRVLRSHILEEEEIPLWPTFYGRIEAFGDVDNEKAGGVIQARNYIRIARYNPRVSFAAWTKNPDIWEKAFEIEGKPENLIMIQSSVSINRPEKPYIPNFDKVFTVWASEEAAAAAGFAINCGARKCLKCLKCYTNNDIVYINELLK